MEDLKTYLRRSLRKATVDKYLYDIERYTTEVRNHRYAGYIEVMHYLGQLRSRYENARTIRTMLYSIKKYYSYLLESGQRKDHPCRYVRLRDARTPEVQIQDLFSEAELEALLERPERYALASLRNRVVMSLLIYQALRTGEIVGLRVKDIDLEGCEVYIRGRGPRKARRLKLYANQVMLLYRYLHECRPQLEAKSGKSQSSLVLTLRGRGFSADEVHYLVETYKGQYPERELNPRTIRQSVIVNQLKKGHDVRLVQVFAGHVSVSSTERYRQSEVEALKTAVERYHPLTDEASAKSV